MLESSLPLVLELCKYLRPLPWAKFLCIEVVVPASALLAARKVHLDGVGTAALASRRAAVSSLIEAKLRHGMTVLAADSRNVFLCQDQISILAITTFPHAFPGALARSTRSGTCIQLGRLTPHFAAPAHTAAEQ